MGIISKASNLFNNNKPNGPEAYRELKAIIKRELNNEFNLLAMDYKDSFYIVGFNSIYEINIDDESQALFDFILELKYSDKAITDEIVANWLPKVSKDDFGYSEDSSNWDKAGYTRINNAMKDTTDFLVKLRGLIYETIESVEEIELDHCILDNESLIVDILSDLKYALTIYNY